MLNRVTLNYLSLIPLLENVLQKTSKTYQINMLQISKFDKIILTKEFEHFKPDLAQGYNSPAIFLKHILLHFGKVNSNSVAKQKLPFFICLDL